MAAVSWAGVRKDYDDVAALRGIDLEAGDGELLAVLGPSGSGKTTLLRVTAGLEAVTEGTVSIGRRDVSRLPPGRRNVAMVFQNYALFPHLDVAENIGFGLEAREVPRRERRARVIDAARVVGCSDLLERRPHELSGGERQRVALARALVRDPDVFLLDEPLSNLDAQLRAQMRGEIRELQRRVNGTMVYVTHDQVEALTLGDRVAVLDAGRLHQVGTPDEVFERPANRFVAAFVGTPAMNFLPARLDGHALRIVTADGAEGRPVEVGIRPDHVRIGGEGDPVGEVSAVEPAGSEAFVHLRVYATTIVARVPSGERPRVGETVSVELRPRDFHVFDAETGGRLDWKP